ncbi:MAG: hypothetical protein HY299_01460 [Verrucomicrobia bacterium]|nr:hypothetical protein [Verrucomicrobiota bacterium]
MWWLPGICLVALVVAVFGFGLVPPAHAKTVLRMTSDGLRVTRGLVTATAREHAATILAEARVSKGFIAIAPGNRVLFSRSIPASLHQRLRNVLLNQ